MRTKSKMLFVVLPCVAVVLVLSGLGYNLLRAREYNNVEIIGKFRIYNNACDEPPKPTTDYITIGLNGGERDFYTDREIWDKVEMRQRYNLRVRSNNVTVAEKL